MLRGESSSNSWRWTYHVFLSFRGEDTRLDFTDHLYAALVRKGIIAFRDDKQLEKGDTIAEELPKAIEESLGAIVILSENYASSSWCLDELNKILESNRVLGREVFPVFYGVSPSEVQHQKTESFNEAFKKHERRSGKDTEKVQKWRDSLKEVGQIPGWESKHYQHQTELIENIVESVWAILRPKMPSFNNGLIGIGSRVKKMDSLLSIESEDVRFIGIWGMGGIGKTTLARVVFQKIKDQFDISCFLDNVREISRESNGMLRLQTKLLSHLAIKGLEIIDLDEGKNTIINLLSEKKVLLVLDDVDDTSQLENLAKRVEWFGRGSRVIITTRDTQVLISHGVVEYYNIEFLNSDESLQLLSQKAFKRDEPQEHYLELSKVVAKHAGGLPLSLELLGSFLCGRSESQWREVVDMIKEVSASHIVMKSLRISYNGLPRRHKALFLDIACFFKGRVKELATQALEICDRYPAVGIELLVEKSLVTYDGFTIAMHDLLQETAREIVIEESHVDAGKRSRLWSLEDTNQVLKYSRENKSIEGIALNSPKKDEANWDPEAFSRMYNLRLLIISFPIKLARGLKCLCSSLKFLQWNDFSMETLPLGVQLDELVELKMYSSKIKNIWNGNQAFAKLKFIDLSYSEDLIQTPIVSGAPCLERMLLIGCINLVEVHPSVGQHKRLVVLSMKNCKNLQIMPRKLEMDSLEELILSGCSKVKKVPEFGKNMKSLSLLSVENCINLLCLPNSICNLKSLRKLYISGCSRLSTLPNGLNENESLEELDVSGTAIREITLSKVRLEKLKELSFGGRKELAPNSQNLLLWISKFMRQPTLEESTMPPLSSLLALVSLDLSYRDLNDESFPSDLGSLSLLQELDLSGNNFINPPAQCIINLSKLQKLSFNDCPRLESLPVLPPNLQGLYANNCPKLKPFNLDEEMLWKIFETQSRMDPIEGPEVWFIIPGNEIPCWFDNQNCHAIDSSYHPYDKLGCDSVTSITVDVPKDCQLSKWWGIAVCLVLEPSNMEEEENSSPSYVKPTSNGNEEMCIYYWVCKAPDRDPDPKFPIASKFGHLVYKFNDPYIHILFLSADHVYIQHYLSGEQIQLQLIFFVENCSKSCKATIKKCGCRVICKEKIEEWRKHSDGLNISRLTEVNDDEEFRHELVVEEPTSPNTSSSTDKTAVNTALDCDNA